jgi:hypothetical protein
MRLDCMASTDRQRWARVRPELAWKRPGLPTKWTHVLERHPENVEALPGCVWLDTPGKVLHVEASWLEFRSDPPGERAQLMRLSLGSAT